MANSLEIYYRPDRQYNQHPDGSVTVVERPPAISRRAAITKPDSTRRRKPKGWLYPTPYAFSKEVRIAAQEDLRYYNTYESTWRREDRPVQYGVGYANAKALSVTNKMRDIAVTKALLKLKDQHLNVGVALAEARMTANLVGSTATRLALAYRSLRKGRFAEARRHLGLRGRSQPANWLELQYGWKPLLSDVYGAAHEVARLGSDFDSWITTVKAVYREQLEFDEYVEVNQPIGRTRIFGKSEASVFVRLDYEPEDHVYMWASRLGLTNPLEIAWELVPYSFVVDWFLPVGDWLSTLDATLGYKFKSGSRSERTTLVLNGQLKPFDRVGYIYRYPSVNAETARLSRKSLKRVVYETSPRPGLPRMKNPLSLGHMANGLSLLAQAFGRR